MNGKAAASVGRYSRMEEAPGEIPPEAAGLDDRTPGGVYLCQVGPAVSCGACCGLYNVRDLSRESLTRMLAERTERFSQVPRTIEAIDRFGGDMLHAEDERRPMKDFHHCPFLGLIGSEKGTVGCLLHPLADGNAGIDWRGLSYYGAYACATYFCPACRDLAPARKRLIRQAADNWYDYGLMITETDLLDAFFDQVENRLGRPLDDADSRPESDACGRIREFLAVKATWPFRDPDRFRAANFFFDKKDYQPPAIDFKGLGVDGSPWAPVLTALWSALPGLAALRQAEVLLNRMADAAAAALER
ncbi:MAG: hypothetical protein AB1724_15830 [Thermodesulfobacteriota bacterium]